MALGGLKQWMKVWAPEGTRRRTTLLQARKVWRRLVPRRGARLRSAAAEPLNVHDSVAWAAFLRECGRSPGRGSGCQPGLDAEACRFVLRLLQDRTDLRQRFPHALGDGVDGAFCRWLCEPGRAERTSSAMAGDRIEVLFRQKPGNRVRQLYEFRSDLRQAFPLALSPMGIRPFLKWLLTDGRCEAEFALEALWWFAMEAGEDPVAGLVATYRMNPDWQDRFPQALTPQGWSGFLDWVCQQQAGDGPWRHVAPQDAYRWITTEKAAPKASAGVNVLAHFCYPSGLQQASRATVQALGRVGLGTSCRDVPANLQSDSLDHANYLGLEIYDQTLIHVAPEPLFEICYPLAGLARRPGVQRIAVWYWELEAVPVGWAKQAAQLQEVWAPTRFIADAMRPVMPVPVVHMLPGVELPPFAPLGRSQFGLPDNRFLFLFMFDMNSVMERKNPLGVIRAFQQAFRPDDRVTLAIKVTRGEAEPGNLERLQEEAVAVGAVVINRTMTRDESYALINACDCYVSLHRSEGFGLTLAEAMLMGKPAIGTAYSGNLDFMTPENSLLVNYRRVPIARDHAVYRKGCVWAEPDTAHAAAHLRWVYEHGNDARALGARAQAELSRLLSLESAGRRMQQRLEALRADRPRSAKTQAA